MTPTRPKDPSESLTSIEKINQKQRERIDQLYHPLQSDLKYKNERPGTIRHHLMPNSSMNKRNKFNRLNEVRQRHQIQQLEYKREKIHDKQCGKDTAHQLKTQAEKAMSGVDIDQLINEERELQAVQDAETQQMLEYEQELESYFSELTID